MLSTFTQSIDDDLKSVRTESIPREMFLRRLLEEFVYVATTPTSTGGRFEIVLLAGEGDEGMFLPIFTSLAHLEQTPLAERYTSAKLPFDALMLQIRPDTGLVINPYTDLSYSIRWFILQEYIPDFGAELVKQEITHEWLQELNAEFNKASLQGLIPAAIHELSPEIG